MLPHLPRIVLPDLNRSYFTALICASAVAWFTAEGAVLGAGNPTASTQKPSAEIRSRRMSDGNEWTTQNLAIDFQGSHCYLDSDVNCVRYGRLYTWDAARQVCASLVGGWRLPTDDEWRRLAAPYGGIREESQDRGKAAYKALISGGASGFDAVLGGDREKGHFARLNAHGFYWTASDTGTATAVFYNFGKGELSLNRQTEGNKQMAISVRCIKG